MARPDRYEISWQSRDLIALYLADHPDDPGMQLVTPEDITVTETRDAPDVAYLIAQAQAEQNDCTVLIYERVGIHDVTPSEDPPGLIWDWEDLRLVDEIQPPSVVSA